MLRAGQLPHIHALDALFGNKIKAAQNPGQRGARIRAAGLAHTSRHTAPKTCTASQMIFDLAPGTGQVRVPP